MYKQIVLLICFVPMLTGCWGREELNEVAVIQTVAIDKEGKDNIRITIEISGVASKGQTPTGLSAKPIYLTETGKSIFEVARKMSNKTTRTLFWGHVSSIVFSKEMAKSGLKKHFDILTRLRQFRNLTNIFIMDGNASDIFKVTFPQESLTSSGLNGLLKAQNSEASTKKVTLMQVFQTLTNDYNDLAIPSLHVYKNPQTQKLNLRVGGMYVFAKDKQIAYMDAEKTKSYLRAINEGKETVEILPLGKKSRYVSFENVRNSANVMTLLQNGMPSVTIELNAKFDVTEVQKEMQISPEQIEKWENQLNALLSKQMEAFISYTKKNKVDLIGIKEMVHRKYPKQWKELKKDWYKIYPDIPFQIVVKSKIEHNFLHL
ncbi:Ger(x)C family germination protein [Aneurinibacillus soli]|uniref:Spore germination protein A3 n=1 Tax=Aneurinibacillus soli TaxID=1500254 RepID=A0A0U5BDT2_9BACL|nr:Ger(x)C family spore germination protein [Aneurinibacillus soli]PYE61751.1 Ger(x)C family germination protein [Aneurinibacillus soli]BAU28391.1 Spore germination protein A3 precursor [Aneurinibacillus soli]